MLTGLLLLSLHDLQHVIGLAMAVAQNCMLPLKSTQAAGLPFQKEKSVFPA